MPRENSRTSESLHALQSRAFQPFHARTSPGPAARIESAEELQVFKCRKLVVDRDAVAQHANSRARLRFAGVFAEERHLAFAGSRQPCKDFQQRGFARAIAAEQGEHLSAIDIEGDIAQRWIVSIEFPDVINGDGLHFAVFAGRAVGNRAPESQARFRGSGKLIVYARRNALETGLRFVRLRRAAAALTQPPSPEISTE